MFVSVFERTIFSRNFSVKFLFWCETIFYLFFFFLDVFGEHITGDHWKYTFRSSKFCVKDLGKKNKLQNEM